MSEASKEPITVLTDPIYGTPGDAIHAYLNYWHGTRVYHAWWLPLPEPRAILPVQPTEVMRSQYERVSAGKVDFQSHGAVYYVTDTNYTQESEIISRQPGARMVARFLKRSGVDAIEVFKLK